MATKVRIGGELESTTVEGIIADAKTIIDREHGNKRQEVMNGELAEAIAGKQETLVSGTNIKTVNGNSLLGSGDLEVGGGASVGTLNTTNTTAQSPVSSESFSGNINLHKISKTGDYTDLNNKPTIPDVSGKADKSEMSVTPGTGANADKTTIQLKSGTSATVLVSHQDISGKQDVINDLSTIRSGAASGATAQQPATTLAGYGITDAYTKTEVNGLVSTPHQEYETVEATSQTTAATDVLPASGQAADTIYRVSNWDGSANSGAGAFDVTKYSEYAWDDVSNPNKYVFLCVKSQIGEVFDISVYNNNAKYADLAAALNGGANIPQSLRKGGMSVKFVQSSDNKYVQARYMGTSTADADFTNTANWQGVDDKPTKDSKDLVTSGGVEAKFSELKGKLIVTTGSAWQEVAITTIPSGTLLTKVTSANNSSKVFARQDASGSLQQQITSGTVLNINCNYIVSGSANDTITLEYGDINEIIYKLDNIKNGIVCESTEKGEINKIVRDIVVYDSNYSQGDSYSISSLIKTGSYYQIRINKNDTLVSAYWSNDLNNIPFLIKIPQYNNSGINAYAIIDWRLVGSTELSATINISNINQKTLSDFLENISSNTSEMIIRPNGLISNSTKNDALNNIIRDISIEDPGYLNTDSYTISSFVKTDSYAQISIKKNGAYVASFYTTEIDKLPTIVDIPEYNNSGVKAKAVINWNKVTSTGISDEVNHDRINQFTSFIPTSYTTKWEAKRILAIGDSVTAAKKWQSEVGNLLNCKIRTHAKGGIGIIGMVDGDGSGDAPQDYDPDTYSGTLYALNEEDVKDVDCIVLMGFYNEVGDTVGNDTDMYPQQGTFKGRLNYTIKRVYEELENANNTTCKIVIASMHKCGKGEYRDYDGYDTRYSSIVHATKECAYYNGLFYIDLYGGVGINKYTWNLYQSSPTAYNPNYIPSDSVLDATNKPFASLSDAPDASQNNGKYITVDGVSGCYKSNGTTWEHQDNPTCVWNGDQLHPNNAGYKRIGEFIAGHIMNI